MLHANIRKRSFAFRYLTLSAGETFSKMCVLVAFGYLVAWFNGHFRFSLVAAGQQWWEFIVAARQDNDMVRLIRVWTGARP